MDEDTRPTISVSPEEWEAFHNTYSGGLIDAAECRIFQYGGQEWTCMSVYYSSDLLELSAYEVVTVPPDTARVNARNMLVPPEHQYTGMVLQVAGCNRRVRLVIGQTRFISEDSLVSPAGRQLGLFNETING